MTLAEKLSLCNMTETIQTLPHKQNNLRNKSFVCVKIIYFEKHNTYINIKSKKFIFI